MFLNLLLVPISLDPFHYCECPTCDKIVSHCVRESYHLSNDIYYMQDEPEQAHKVEIMKAKVRTYQEIIKVITDQPL